MNYTNVTKQQPQSQFLEDQGVDLPQDTDQSQSNRSEEKMSSILNGLTRKPLQSLQLFKENGPLTVEKAAELLGIGVTVTSRRFRRLWGDPRLSNSLSPEDRLLGRRPLKGVVSGARQNANEYFLLPDVKPELIEQAIAQYKSDKSKEEEEEEDDGLEAIPNSEEVTDYDLISKLKDKLAVTKKQADEYHAEASRLEAEATRLYSLVKSMEETIEGLIKVTQ